MNLSHIEWTVELVEEWLNMAAKTERALPPVYRKGPAGRKWEVVCEWYELLWDQDDDDREPKFRPTNEQVSQWEEVVLKWFQLVDSGKDKKILWLRACEMGWARIGKRVGLTRQTVAVRHHSALRDLARSLKTFYHIISQNPTVDIHRQSAPNNKAKV